jgi:hypothetical protein
LDKHEPQKSFKHPNTTSDKYPTLTKDIFVYHYSENQCIITGITTVSSVKLQRISPVIVFLISGEGE